MQWKGAGAFPSLLKNGQDLPGFLLRTVREASGKRKGRNTGFLLRILEMQKFPEEGLKL